MDCWLCGDASLLIRDVICDLFNTTIYIESCTALLQHYDLTHKWATQHNNLLSSFIECVITCFYLVYHHAFVRCTTMLLFGVLLSICLVYAIMLLFGVCYHAIRSTLSCFYLVYKIMLLFGVHNHVFMVYEIMLLFGVWYLLFAST